MSEPRNLPISSRYRQSPGRAVAEADREDVNRQLNDAFASGSISPDDYRVLLDRVYAATTLGELEPVVAQLPARQTHEEPAMVAQDQRLAPGELSQARPAAGLMGRVMTLVGAGAVLVLVLAALILLLG